MSEDTNDQYCEIVVIPQVIGLLMHERVSSNLTLSLTFTQIERDEANVP